VPTILKNLAIRTRLLLLCLAVATPLLAMCGLVIWKEYRGLAQVTRRATTFHDELAVRTLQHWVDTQQSSLEVMSRLPQIESGKSLPAAAHQLLTVYQQLHRNCNGIALCDLTGKVIATAGDSNATLDISGSSAWKAAVAGKAFVSGYTRCPFTDQPAVLISQPVMDNGKSQSKPVPSAVLVESIKPDAILQLFAGVNDAKGFVISVIDTDKRIIARSLDNDKWQGRDFSRGKTVQAAERESKGTIEVIGIADPTPRTYAFERMPSTGWLVVTGLPTASTYGSAQERLLILTFSTIVAVAVAVFLAYAFTRHFTGPINELVREALSIGRGDLSKRVQTSQGGELGLLARAFNQMALNLELNREHKTMIERISESIRQSLDMDEILNTTVFELGRALNASRCCLAVVENSGQDIAGKQLEFNYVWFNDKLGGTALKNRSLMITEGSILKIILEQGAILSLDVMDDSTFTPLFEQADDSAGDWKSIKSLIACPIILDHQPIGMILVHQCDRRRVWFELELELVENVARHVALALDHGHLFQRMREMAEQQVLINQIVRASRKSLDANNILETVTKELGEALKADYCQIAQPRPEGPLVVTHEFHQESLPAHKGLSIYGQRMDFHPEIDDPQELRSVLGIDLSALHHLNDGDAPDSLQALPMAVMPDVAEDRRAAKFAEFLGAVASKSLIAAPLLQDDRILGILIVHQCQSIRDWQAGEVRLVAAVADQLAVAISHAQLFEQVKHQAITDGLTGLYNHIYFKNRMAEELNRAQRKGTACSLLMVDLDKLKQINDTYGHPIGDAAIRQVANTFKILLRSGDTAARYGGEEFAVILPETPLSEAVMIADRLRRNINRTPIPGLGHISASIGAASFPGQAKSLEDIIEKADQALYSAKRGGRNRVCVWDDPAPILVASDESAQLLTVHIPDDSTTPTTLTAPLES
jgi:diguanylate cyclase (GGDEF)-like protein